MANLISKGFILNFITNLHAGSGDANYGIIDKLVQRDPSTSRPIIHSSSLKGALREFFEQPHKYPTNDKGMTNNFISEIFGTHQKDQNMVTGKCRFLAAYLLSIPVRSNAIPFFMATSIDVLKELKEEAANTGYKLKPELIHEIDAVIELFSKSDEEKDAYIFTEKYPFPVILEDWKATSSKINITELEKLTGNNLAIFNSKSFAELCNQLPVIARNQLENGTSKNLWYEEVVPRFTRFFQFTLIPDEDNQSINTFLDELTDDKNTFQIGANATIGYGYCKITKL